MNLTRDDYLLFWRSLASYIEECREIASSCDEQEVIEYYNQQIEESKNLRSKIRNNYTNVI